METIVEKEVCFRRTYAVFATLFCDGEENFKLPASALFKPDHPGNIIEQIRHWLQVIAATCFAVTEKYSLSGCCFARGPDACAIY